MIIIVNIQIFSVPSCDSVMMKMSEELATKGNKNKFIKLFLIYAN